MAVRIALLRAVNVAGKNLMAMPALREVAAGFGTNARTLLQSGNLVFESAASAAVLEGSLARALEQRFHFRTEVLVRTAPELRTAVAGNPFPREAREDPGHLLLLFLKAAPARGGLAALRQAMAGPELIELTGRHAYVVYPDGVGRSKLTSAVLERHLGTPVTGRNWNTVLKLLAVAEEGAGGVVRADGGGR